MCRNETTGLKCRRSFLSSERINVWKGPTDSTGGYSSFRAVLLCCDRPFISIQKGGGREWGDRNPPISMLIEGLLSGRERRKKATDKNPHHHHHQQLQRPNPINVFQLVGSYLQPVALIM